LSQFSKIYLVSRHLVLFQSFDGFPKDSLTID